MSHKILDVVRELDDAFNAGDLERVLWFYDKNASVVAEPGITITGREALHAFFTKVLNMQGKAKQLKTSVIDSGNLALFISEWTFSWLDGYGNENTRSSIATTVFKMDTSGQWKIVIDNSFGPEILK